MLQSGEAANAPIENAFQYVRRYRICGNRPRTLRLPDLPGLSRVFADKFRVADNSRVGGDKRVCEDLWRARKFDGNFRYLSSVPFRD